MKTFGSFINKNTLTSRKVVLDEKSVFFVFNMIVKEEYGKQGVENIRPVSFRDGKMLIKATGATWPTELWNNRTYILKRLNDQVGDDIIIDLMINS